MEMMEIRIKINGEHIQLEETVTKIRKIEKEHSCNCTLLEVEAKII